MVRMNYEAGKIDGQEARAIPDLSEGAGRRGRRNLIIALLLAALALAAAYWFFAGKGAEGAGGPPQGKREAQLPTVTVISPGRQPIDRAIAATGSLAARREMPVGIAG